MKCVFALILGSFLPLAAIAAERATWMDLDLNQTVQVTDVIRAGTVTLPQGQRMKITRVLPLDMIHVTEFTLSVPNCTAPNVEGEMEIYLPAGSPEGAEIGLQFHPGCVLGIYIEGKDLQEKSIFHLAL